MGGIVCVGGCFGELEGVVLVCEDWFCVVGLYVWMFVMCGCVGLCDLVVGW